MARHGRIAHRLAMHPISQIEPRPNATDSARAANRLEPKINRHCAASQKYSGGWTSALRRSRAILAKLAWPACASAIATAGNTPVGQAGRAAPAVRNRVYCSSYSAPRNQAEAVNTKALRSSTPRRERMSVALTKYLYFQGSLRLACTSQRLTECLCRTSVRRRCEDHGGQHFRWSCQHSMRRQDLSASIGGWCAA